MKRKPSIFSYFLNIIKDSKYTIDKKAGRVFIEKNYSLHTKVLKYMPLYIILLSGIFMFLLIPDSGIDIPLFIIIIITPLIYIILECLIIFIRYIFVKFVVINEKEFINKEIKESKNDE